MKKIFLIISIAFIAATANAQSTYDPFRDSSFMFDLIHITGTLLGFFLVGSFLLAIIKLIFDHRIKNRIIEKGVGENVVSTLLKPDRKDNTNAAIKWFIIFAGIGTGLTLISHFRPFGIHSLAIMSFCIAAGFLGYYFFTKNSEKNKS
ncbi:MAG: hypothetical protein JST75_22410 [Bacteroidetes bacterium]|nr:hypothetical protein [Bacteroidota bacterium]